MIQTMHTVRRKHDLKTNMTVKQLASPCSYGGSSTRSESGDGYVLIDNLERKVAELGKHITETVGIAFAKLHDRQKRKE